MRKFATTLAVLFGVSMLVGCSSVPDWVTKGSGAYAGDRGKAIYGVGIAPSDPNTSLQHNMAKFDARAELARSKRAYVAELIKSFVQKHQDYYDEEGASSVQFYQQAGKQVTDATLYDTQVIDTWFDKGGDLGAKGTLYVLVVHPVDSDLLNETQKQYESLIRRYKAEVIKRDADAALEELKVELENARQAPFALTGPVFPGAAPAQ